MEATFVWDPEKAASNLRKHGVSFETATRIFLDPHLLSEQDRVEGGEQRWQSLGIVETFLMVLVAHTTWDEDDGTEVIRIISARPATKSERRRYEQQRR